MVSAQRNKDIGDQFYINSEFEEAYKAYEITCELFDHFLSFCSNEDYQQLNLREMRLETLLAMTEAAF